MNRVSRFLRTVLRTSVLASIFFFGWLFFMGFMALPLGLVNRFLPRSRRFTRAFFEGFYRLLIRALVAVRALSIEFERGEKYLDLGSPAIYVGNHRTLLDVLILLSRVSDSSCLARALAGPAIKHRDKRSAMPAHWRAFIQMPMKMAGYVPMPADTSNPIHVVDTFRRCLREIDDGRSFIVFPEGTRSRTGHLGPFQDFAFKLATRACVPVVPVVFDVQAGFMTRGIIMNDDEMGRFRITVLPPIHPDSKTSARDLSVEVRHKIKGVLEKNVCGTDERSGHAR